MPRQRLSPLTVAFIILCNLPAPAQRRERVLPPVPLTVSGQVRVAGGASPPGRVVVRLEASEGGFVGEAEADRAGKFRFTNLGPAHYVVTARAPGYTPARQEVELQTGPTVYVQLNLAPESSGAEGSLPASPPVALSDPNVPPDAQTEFERGRAAVAARNTEEGLAHLGRAVKLYPNFYEAHLLTGTALMDAGRWDESATALRRAAELNPKSAPARFALGEVYLRRKMLEEAERELREGLRLDAKSARGYFTLGRVYWERGDYVKAGPEVGRALRLDPTLAEAHLLAGNILLRARRAEDALTEFEEYLRLAPAGEFAEPTKQLVRKIRQALAGKK